MKNRDTKLKALLFVIFMASMVMVGTMPMIMADSTDGGGGGSTRLYASSYYTETQTGYMSGTIYSSGSCYMRVSPNHDGYGLYKWTSYFTKTTDFKVKDVQSINVKMYGDYFFIDYAIQLSVQDGSSWDGIWDKSYRLANDAGVHWQTKSWLTSYTDISSPIDVSHWGYNWRVDITITGVTYDGYISRTSSTSYSAYYNSAVYLINP